jgi:hypothetical protein
MKHVLPAATVAACTLVLCAACTGSSSPGTGTGGTGGTATSTSAAPSTASATTAAGGTTATATVTGTTGGSGTNATQAGGGSAGASTCTARYLNGSVSGEQGTAGSVYVDIVFKNLNNVPWTMYGYPGVSFGAGTPVQQVGQPADRNPQASSKLVTLQPGGHAYAVLQITEAGNYPASTCQPTATTYLQVYPPNTTNQLYIAYNSTACKGNVVTLHVQAVQPGTGA